MSRCQACDKQATHHSKHGALRARCCSERCGRELFAGLSVVDDGAIHVAAASPLGRAIAQRTGHRCDHILPANVAAQLVGALQRIGPKRAATDADLPASAQADVPTPIDWIADVPRDVWATAILPYLQRDDLRAFAATSSSSAAHARDERVQAAKYRETHTAYDAALAYAATAVGETRRRVLRLAYPNVAELALARLLVFDVEQIYRLGFSPNKYRHLVARLRTEAGRNGDELYARPIQVPIPPRTIVLERRLVESPPTVPAMAGALIDYAFLLQHDMPGSRLMDYLQMYANEILTPNSRNGALETPDTPCFFSYPYLFGCRALNAIVAADSLDHFVSLGVDLTRTDAGFWFADTCARSTAHNVFDDTMDAIMPDTRSINFDGPRADGQMSLLCMAKYAWGSDQSAAHNVASYQALFRFLRERNIFGTELRAPAIWGDGSGNTVLHLLARPFVNSHMVNIVVETDEYMGTADGIANPPLLVQNALGEIPLETIIASIVELDADDMDRYYRGCVRYVILTFALKCHPFAHSTVRSKPIISMLPLKYQAQSITDIHGIIAPADWNNIEVKRYLAYLATQAYTGALAIDQITPIVNFLFQRFEDIGAAPAVVEPLRPLLARLVDDDDPLKRWFQ